ncbi:hypothetical protein [Marinobacter salicampi]|uniref:hypothetical protein n=1 Tax=Marinobacter salicampi TaxID=435907 RepID=UPI0014099AF2|nr:hypothetical protein [Marinobacter salicampi]
MNIELTPGRVYSGLLAIIGFLLLANLAVVGVVHFTVHDYAWGLIRLFSFDAERSVPAFYASVALLASALLLFATGRLQNVAGESAMPWYVLGVVFAFLSFDEIASIHERLINPMRELFNASGILYYAWVIPYGIAVLLLGLVYVPFLLKLPRRTAIIFITSGCVFVSGAIGIELIGARHVDLYGADNLAYSMIFTAEELLEKLGIATFIFGILDYMASRFGLSTRITTSPLT